MSNVFGENTVSINVECPTPKLVEQISNQLPTTGVTENVIFGAAVLALALYFYARARQVKKEILLIRRDITTGAI